MILIAITIAFLCGFLSGELLTSTHLAKQYNESIQRLTAEVRAWKNAP